MTVPFERTNAVIQTREFLQELRGMPQMPESVRAEAKRLLRHYPSPAELNIAHRAVPDWWGPVAADEPKGQG